MVNKEVNIISSLYIPSHLPHQIEQTTFIPNRKRTVKEINKKYNLILYNVPMMFASNNCQYCEFG